MPQLARAVVLGEQIPVCLRDDAERGDKWSEPVVRDDHTVGVPDERIDLAEGEQPQMVDLVRANMKRPVRKGHVNPVCRRAKRTPVRADGRAGRRGEVELLVRADPIHDESAPEIVAVQSSRGVRRGDRREVRPLVGDGRWVTDETALRRQNPALQSLLLVVRDCSGGIKRLESTSGADHQLNVVCAAVTAATFASAVPAAIARLGAGDHPHGNEERAEQHTPDFRLFLEERHEVLHGADVLLVHERDKPRDGRCTREGEEKRCPES